MDISRKFLPIVALVLSIVVYLDAVTANPSLCPTNKIAPRRSAASLREESESRTLGVIFGLTTPNRPRPSYNNNLNGLQEQPQEDEVNDCIDIEDYDETDLSSITRPAQNYVNNKRYHRQLFEGSYNTPSYYPEQKKLHKPRPPQRPQKPQRPTYNIPFRPQYNFGGMFGSNVYRPPSQNNPSAAIKPVYENAHENPQEAYTPGLVGGVVGQVVGFSPVRPTYSNERLTSLKKPRTPFRFPNGDSYIKRHGRAEQPTIASNIIGSFVDLFLN